MKSVWLSDEEFEGDSEFLICPTLVKRRKNLYFFSTLYMFKHKIIIIMIRLQLIIMMNTPAHKDFFHGVVTFDDNDISAVYSESSSGDKVDRVLLK